MPTKKGFGALPADRGDQKPPFVFVRTKIHPRAMLHPNVVGTPAVLPKEFPIGFRVRNRLPQAIRQR
jgi:hypothetical protein